MIVYQNDINNFIKYLKYKTFSHIGSLDIQYKDEKGKDVNAYYLDGNVYDSDYMVTITMDTSDAINEFGTEEEALMPGMWGEWIAADDGEFAYQVKSVKTGGRDDVMISAQVLFAETHPQVVINTGTYNYIKGEIDYLNTVSRILDGIVRSEEQPTPKFSNEIVSETEKMISKLESDKDIQDSSNYSRLLYALKNIIEDMGNADYLSTINDLNMAKTTLSDIIRYAVPG